ncbi:ParA family protein [Methylobacterium isbiliense]|uniref:ParA family protein n=1 Tax=Methylobacterium isbiliense TaxID=315478 RepID=UPI001EDCDD72|nr:AAA family ATPase [Methylobacterium isbiliense]MDN3622714.1 AAA family ATPase [Methylobacterium isbiliense]
MKSIAFFNNKGGVGKTTLLCNVAAYISLYKSRRVCIVDVDPQCNATQYLFGDKAIQKIYRDEKSFTIHKIIEPLAAGEGYTKDVTTMRAKRFSVDLIPGDPRLALTEDLLARDWNDARAGDVRGIRTNLVFSELLSKLGSYDFVFFDVSPSLGALNRSVMLSSDYFMSPVSLDIFSLKAFENISRWINDWWQDWERGLDSVKYRDRLPSLHYSKPEFIGYVTQQYLAKKDEQGQRRAVQAYEEIRKQIDAVIIANGLAGTLDQSELEIGTVPNLFSLVPMSQSNHAPIFELSSSDGVVGAHFSKVKDSKKIFEAVSERLLERAV